MPIALDTHVLMRFLTQDYTEEFKIAQGVISSCIATRPAFICREVLVELVWVLERSYKYSRNEITAAVMRLVSAAELQLETAPDVA